MIITFIGHGYVGLVTATVFADLGNTVYVIGHTPEKIENLKKGILPIYEPGLEEMVKRNVMGKRLLFTLDYTEAVSHSDVVFIAVGTPPLASGDADLSVVFDVAEQIAKNLTHYTVVVTKSTVPVGTHKRVHEIIENNKQEGVEFSVASTPEFLREGQAIGDTLHPDRVVIGTDDDRAKMKLVELHEPLSGEVLLTNIPTAEMIKYASNAFLATKISYANAIAQLSEKLAADGVTVLKAVGIDKRIGGQFLNAGAGYGGSCFPKDVKALVAISDEAGYSFGLLKEVEEINKRAMLGIVEKTKMLLGGDVKGKTIGILGLAFKPDTDDMRDAPAVVVINALQADGAVIKAYDPIAMQNAKRILPGITLGVDAYEVVEDCDVLIVITEWREFKELDLTRVKALLKSPKLIDARNMYDPEKVKGLGFEYAGVGR